jgi:hypothetical protein
LYRHERDGGPAPTTQGEHVKKLLVLGAASVGLLLAGAAPASAGSICYDVNIGLSGQAPIVQAGCQDIPDLPALP